MAVVGVQTVRLDPPPPEGFRPERLSLSLGGQYAALAGVVEEPAGGSGAEPRPLLLCVDLAGLARYRGRDADDVRCRSVALGGARLEQQRSLRVRKLRWHPRSAFHVAALLEDSLTGAAAFHLYNVGRDRALPEQEYGLFPGGPRGFGLFDYDAPGSEILRDFTWAPEAGWGLFSVLFLGSSGGVFTLGPLAPFGALYPREEVRALADEVFPDAEAVEGAGEDSDRAVLWLEGVFPDLASGAATEVEAQPFALREAAPALRGPLQAFPEGRQGGAGGEACALAVGSPGPGCTVVSQADHTGTVTVQLLAGDFAPLWEDSMVDCIFAPGGTPSAPDEVLAHVTCDLAVRSSGANQLSLLTIECVELGGVSSSERGLASQLLVDPQSGGDLYCHHANGLHLITLPWAASVVDWLGAGTALGGGSAESEDEGEDEAAGGVSALSGPDLAPPVVRTLMYGETEPAGAVLVTDRLGGGEVVCFDRQAGGKGGDCMVRFIPATGGPGSGAGREKALSPEKAAVEGADAWDAREELREVEAWYKELTEGGAPRGSLPVASKPMAAATPEGQRYLHECVVALSKAHIERCHQIHERCLGREDQLREEFERQEEKKEEVALKLKTELNKAKAVKARLARAKALHKNLAARVKILAELDSSRPMELSGAEVKALQSFKALEEIYEKFGGRIQECKRRSGALLATRTPDAAPSPSPGGTRAPIRPKLPTRAGKPPHMQQLLVQTADTVRDNVALAQELTVRLGAGAAQAGGAPPGVGA